MRSFYNIAILGLGVKKQNARNKRSSLFRPIVIDELNSHSGRSQKKLNATGKRSSLSRTKKVL